MSQNICSALQVVRESIAKAGPNLTQNSFLQGAFQLKGFITADFASVSFSQNKLTGADSAATAQFKKARWSDTNDYWRVVTPYTPFPIP